MQKESKEGTIRNIDNLVSQRLRERRLMLGLGLKETGEAIGVKPAFIQKYENSTYNKSGEESHKLVKLAKSLKSCLLVQLITIFNFTRKKTLKLLHL